MAYEKHNFKSGDILTASKLNEMDEQIEKNSKSGGSGSFTDIILNQNEEHSLLGGNLLTPTGWTLGNGWTGSLEEGFTHVSGGTGELSFSCHLEVGKRYLVEFTNSTPIVGYESLLVSVGGSPTHSFYGFPNPLTMGVKCVDANSGIVVTIASTYATKLTFISLREIVEGIDGHLKVMSSDNYEIFAIRGNSENLFIGDRSGQNITTGFSNVALGKQTLRNAMSAPMNTAVGHNALGSLENGSRNTAIGFQSMNSLISGYRNIGIGSFAMSQNKEGHYNVSIGSDSMLESPKGDSNVAIGFQALYHVEANNNIGIGDRSLPKLTTGDANIGIGTAAMGALTTGRGNIALGYDTLAHTASANYNMAIGYGAMAHNTNGPENVAIGFNAGNGSNDASQMRNVIIGSNAGKNIYNGVNFNVLIGYNAGQNLVSGANNICIGQGADVPASKTSNHISIGTSAHETVQIAGKTIHFNEDGTVTWS